MIGDQASKFEGLSPEMLEILANDLMSAVSFGGGGDGDEGNEGDDNNEGDKSNAGP